MRRAEPIIDAVGKGAARVCEHAVPDRQGGPEALWSWQGDLLGRIARGLAEQQEPDYAAAYGEALSALCRLDPADDLAPALRLQLAYYRFQGAGIFASTEIHQAEWCQAVYELSIPEIPAPAERLRVRLLIQVLCKGDALGYEPLPPASYYRLAAQLPQDQRCPEFWYNVAGWAFRHGQQAVLDEAYAAVLTNPGNYLPTASWLRINLMHLLLEKRAGSADVLAYLRSVAHPALLEEFESYILDAVKAAGLDGAAVYEALLAQRRVLSGVAKGRWYEPPTRHLIGSRGL